MEGFEPQPKTEPTLSSHISELDLDIPPPPLRLGRMALEEIVNDASTVDDVIDSYIEAGLIVELD